MTKEMKQVTEALAEMHESLGDEYLDVMRGMGFMDTCPVVAWCTEIHHGQPFTEATLLWDDPVEAETVRGCPFDMLVHHVCVRAVNRLRAVASN